MSNINRDYLLVLDVKSGKLEIPKLNFYILDKYTANIYINLVTTQTNKLIKKYSDLENASDYKITMHVIKPSNNIKEIEAVALSTEESIYQIDLQPDFLDEIGKYKCELIVEGIVDGRQEIIQSSSFKYRVKKSIYNDLDDQIENVQQYPIIITLLDKLQDINQYEEDRRTAEIARQIAETNRVNDYNSLRDTIGKDINTMDEKISGYNAKLTEVDNAVSDMRTNIDEYHQSKDDAINNSINNLTNKVNNSITEGNENINNAINSMKSDIDFYKAEKDVEITNEINNQNDKINSTIESQNTRLDAIETKNQQQDNRLDVVEAKNVEQDNRLDVIEAIDIAQNNRLDAIESKNTEQDDRLLDIEKVNKRQDIDIKCLYGATPTVDITEEGNSIYLQNSNNGFTIIDEIKGNTLVNCNKEPHKELVLNGNINARGDNNITITEGVNGGLVDVALEGNTLVNVSNTKDSTALPLEEELTYLYANTQYTLQFVSDKAITADITLGGTPLLAQSIVAGLNRISITTPETLVDNKLIINGVGAKINEVVVTDTNREFGYFEGMKSVGECEGNVIEIVSQNNGNIYDGNYILDKYINVNGKESSSKDWCATNFLEVLPNTLYTQNYPHSSSPVTYCAFYDKDKNFIGVSANNVSSYTTPSDCKYIRTCWRYLTTSLEGFIVQMGDVANVDIPHQSNSQTLTHEPLRAVGDAKDRYVLIDGKWYIERNCGSATFDGSDDEEWYKLNQTIYRHDMTFNEHTNDSCNDLISNNRLVTVYSNYANINYDNYIYSTIDSFNLIRFNSDVDSVKQELKNNPIEIVYQLPQTTYEPIDYNPLEIYSDITHITTNSTIPTNIIVKNHGFNCLLKPSTTYTISSNLGLNTVTTPSTLTEDCLRFMDTDTSDVTTMRDVLVLEGDWTTKADLIPANFSGIESAFEQELVTNEADPNYGKYKVNVKVVNEDKTKENNITFYINEPLRGVGTVKDRVYIKDNKVVIERNCGIRAYEDGDFGTYLTDKVNTVYQLAEPVYEEVEYNDTKLFIESFKNSTLFYNSNVPVTSKLYYSYSVPIVDKVAKTASISDEQDQLIIDLATQCAVMEMYLM